MPAASEVVSEAGGLGASFGMAETWQMLLKHQQERSRWHTIALAERFRNVLFLSDVAAITAAKQNDNEKAT